MPGKFLHFNRKLSASTQIIFFLFSVCTACAYGQPDFTGYNDVARQRLLIRITAHYMHTVSQGQIDMDSAIRIPCKLYGLSPLLAYNEGYSDGTANAGSRLLDAGKVQEAAALLVSLDDESRLRLLLDLGSYFTYKPGQSKADLDKASKYINEAENISAHKPIQWQIASLTLKANLLDQYGLTGESRNLFVRIIKLAEQSRNNPALARTLLNAAGLLHYGDPMRLPEFQRALGIFHSARAKEKEIETLSEINIEYFVFKKYDTAERLVHRIADLQKEINYNHQQYAYDVLAYLTFRRGDLTSALTYSTKSLESLTRAPDSVFINCFYTRRAELLIHMMKFDQALTWLNKAIENNSDETRLFWYKAFLLKANLLNMTGRPAGALALLNETGKRFPPNSNFEKMYFAMTAGEAEEKLKKFDLAEFNYNLFLKLAKDFPPEYIHGEFPYALDQISAFYRIIGKTDMARQLLERGKSHHFKIGVQGKGMYYDNLFKIDSTEKRYFEAISDLEMGQLYRDSAFSDDQRKKVDELLVKYEAEKKDRDIKLLNNQNQLQIIRVQEADRTKNITLAGIVLLLVIIGLLFNRYQLKQKSNRKLESSQRELDQKNVFLETLNAEQQKLLKEKEWLIKEVHHRVKNNLQMVTSLLNTQTIYLQDDAAIVAVKDSLRRMQAMSLIHQKLYQKENISTIAMPDYIDELVRYLHVSFGTGNAIEFEQTIEPLNLDVSQAIPLGLIITESIVNTIKYAFLNGRKGIVRIRLQFEEPDHLLLSISDNGIGLPQGMNIMENNSLGLDLMKGLSGQLNGNFRIDSDAGVHIRVKFPVSNKQLNGND